MAVLKKRIDQLLVERGMAESRHKAQALLLAGRILVGGQKVEKPGQRVDVDAAIRIIGALPFVSRAGAKLQGALESFGITAAGRVCADLGASTGGFADCLIQHGARQVHAFDVGKGQLAWKLRADPRVVIHDAFNVRSIAVHDLPEEISLVTVDLSFISLTKVLAPLREALRGRMGTTPVDIILLVKPQFEVGKGQVGKGGIVREPDKRVAALGMVTAFAVSTGFQLAGTMPSPVHGSKGNLEFLVHLRLLPDLIFP